jgi:hypothetical protein
VEGNLAIYCDKMQYKSIGDFRTLTRTSAVTTVVGLACPARVYNRCLIPRWASRVVCRFNHFEPPLNVAWKLDIRSPVGPENYVLHVRNAARDPSPKTRNLQC